jgi:DNA-binding response OmpR family regulator
LIFYKRENILKILVIEDEEELCKSIVAYLKSENYLCEIAMNYNTAIKKIDLYEYDCILLDITLPGGNGLNLLRHLKSDGKLDGVLIISAKNSLDDKITGLKLGADDYLTKPFHLSELSARIAAIIRRRKFKGEDLLKFMQITIDTSSKVAYYDGTVLDLTKKEFDLLLYFVTNKRKVISKNALAQHLWGDEMDMANNFDFIYTHIKNLRKKLMEKGSPDYIKSIYGMGYKFSDQ